MHSTNLRSVDLNLLLVLRVLLRDQSVTRAAVQLNMSQPAVSHALNRLRHLFDDQLLVRCGHRMELTPRAERIATSIDRILNDISCLIERPEFDPATAAGRIAICATEGAVGTISEALLEAQKRAPDVLFEIRSDVHAPREDLKTGRIDLYMDSHTPFQGGGFVSVGVFKNRIKCVASRHSLPSGTIDRREFETRSHVVIAGGTEDQIADYLEKQGVRRKVAIIAPGYFSAARIVSQSELILSLPEALANSACGMFPLVAAELPVIAPEVSLSLSWHARRSDDPLHRWARELLIKGARGELTPGVQL